MTAPAPPTQPTHHRSPSYSISVVAARSISDATLTQCAELFSNNYGVWSEACEPPLRPGTRVKMSAARLRSMLLFDESCGVVLYKQSDDDLLVGQAFYCTFSVPEHGDVRWITQLVVSDQHRRRGIAEVLLHNTIFKCNGHSLFAAGLVSSHPAAVRALQRACGPTTINAHNNVLYARRIHTSCTVPYLRPCQLHVDESRCVVDTHFFVDHTEVLTILRQTSQWVLGDLLEGHEFFAIAICPPLP